MQKSLPSGSAITVQEWPVLVVVGAAGGAEFEEAGDLLVTVVRDEVDVDPVLHGAGFSKAALTKNHGPAEERRHGQLRPWASRSGSARARNRAIVSDVAGPTP
jgi:hypothetical protein